MLQLAEPLTSSLPQGALLIRSAMIVMAPRVAPYAHVSTFKLCVLLSQY